MRITFSRKLEYQFGFFIRQADGEPPVKPEAVLDLEKHFQGGDDSLPIKLSPGVSQEGLVTITGENLLAVPVMLWGGGLWKLTWTPLRVDLHVSASTFEEASGKELSLRRAGHRAQKGLRSAAEALSALGFKVHRGVVVVTGESDLAPVRSEALGVIARRFFGPEIQTAVREGHLTDLGYRGDWSGESSTASGRLPLHRIENVGTQVSFTEGKPTQILRAQWDVNTSPARGVEALDLGQLESFYEVAVEWTEDRMTSLRSAP